MRVRRKVLVPFFVTSSIDQFDHVYNALKRNKDAVFGILVVPFIPKSLVERLRSIRNDIDVARRLFIFCDSGAFLKAGKKLPYPELFDKYQEIGVDWGVVFDTLYDKFKTLKTTATAMKYYNYKRDQYTFQLIGVAQGTKPDDYLECIMELYRQGYKYIAIGGSLERIGASGVRVRVNEEKLYGTLSLLQRTIKPQWLFVFGVFNEKRYKILRDYGIWGADSKRWLMAWPHRYELFKNRLVQIGSPYADVFRTLHCLFKASSSTRFRHRENREVFEINTKRRYDYAATIKNAMTYISLAEKDPILMALTITPQRDVTRAFVDAYLDGLAELQRTGEFTDTSVYCRALLSLTDRDRLREVVIGELLKQAKEPIAFGLKELLRAALNKRQIEDIHNFAESLLRKGLETAIYERW